jgi:ABC-type transporter Mla subunit MlaD
MEKRLGTIDERLAALVTASERQSATLDRQSETLDRQSAALDRQSESIDRTSRNLDRLSEEVRELVISSREQRQSLQLMASMVGELVKAISTSMSKATERLVALTESSAQASEVEAIIAQDNQNAVRDLIAQMREGR